jgi:hypothetical protein
MAQQVSAFIYGQGNATWTTTTGIEQCFPTANIVFIKLTPPTILTNGTMNTKIKVLGTNDTYAAAPEFYTDKDITTLLTESNT